MKLTTRLLAMLFAFALMAAACGSDDGDTTESGAADSADSDSADSDSADSGGADSDGADSDGADADGGGEAASCDAPPTKAEGVLTVATGEPVFEPWMVDDDPSNEKGFESALVYALAGEMGIDTVEWVRTGFDAAIAPGDKDYDFNIQQFSITSERDEVVDFSDGYYQVEQAIIGSSDSDVAAAVSVAELADFQLGAAIGTTSLAYIEDEIAPSATALVFDDNAAAKSAFDAGQVEGIIFDLPTAYYITAVEIPDAAIIGVLPRAGEPEELGMLFEDGSPLVACVNEALGALRDGGQIEALEDEWLNQGGSIPSLTN